MLKRSTIFATTLAVAFTFGGTSSNADDSFKWVRWWTGNDFLGMPLGEQSVAASSVAEGVQVGLYLANDRSTALKLRNCIQDWTAGQAAAVLSKWFNDNPGSRHISISAAFVEAVLVNECDALNGG